MSTYPDTTDQVTLARLAQKKRKGEKITVLTAYDYPLALLVDGSGVDVTLVGDSLGMEELGLDTTVPVTMEIMLHHVRAVRRGTKRALLVADMPFLSYQVNADEAVRNVEKYLDDAYAAGLIQARVVHGKGTGALRRAVQEYLTGHPLVSSFATANADEGGAGATIVNLKET